MKNKFLVIGLILLIVITIAGIFFYFRIWQNNTSPSDYEADKTATDSKQDTEENTAETAPIENSETEVKQEEPPAPAPSVVEELLTTFSTKIYSTDAARQTNINITCTTLTDTIVKVGETFSFTNTVGQATTSKGYLKADVFDKDGNKKKGLGGGNCQISTTLYNAILALPELKVLERHPHSNYVPYVPKNKDAAVAYGSYDLKFRNDSRTDLKIKADSDGKTVNINLYAIKYEVK